jgi:predicted nucleic acid-binding protein
VIHLDTSFLIRGLVSGSPEDRALRRWLRRGDAVGVSAIAWAEFLCGPVSAVAVEEAAELLGAPARFDGLAATVAASLFNASGRRRGTLVDCMIAAVALHADASLATSNAADFRRFEPFGLVLA